MSKTFKRYTPQLDENGKRLFSEQEWLGIERMFEAGCTLNEVIASCRTNAQTLTDACMREFGVSLNEFRKDCVAVGDQKIRTVRFEMAVKRGSWRAVEFLSKTRLNENPASKVDVNHKSSKVVTVVMPKNGREITPDLLPDKLKPSINGTCVEVNEPKKIAH